MVHHLLKSEHPIVVFAVRIGVVRVWMMGVEELDDVEAATIDIEMNVALLEIGRMGLPDANFGMHPFHLAPSGKTDATTVDVGRYEQQLQFAQSPFLVDSQHDSADFLPVADDAIGLGIWLVDGSLNGFARDDFPIFLEMVVAHSELLGGTVSKSLLIIEDELLSVGFFKRLKRYLGRSHFNRFHSPFTAFGVQFLKKLSTFLGS